MSTQCKRVFFRFLLFALLGLVIEVLFTGLNRLSFEKGYFSMVGHTSPWMMLDYGLLGLLTLPIQNSLKKLRIPLPGRAIAYMLGIFAIEYFSGLILNVYFGLDIWDYKKLGYDLHGQITLKFAPFWYVLGLFVEPLHRRIDACAVVLARRLQGDMLMDLPVEKKEDLGSDSSSC